MHKGFKVNRAGNLKFKFFFVDEINMYKDIQEWKDIRQIILQQSK